MARQNKPSYYWLVTFFLSILLVLTARAQDDVLEYKMDFGVGVGPCFYMGDANSTPFANSSVMVGLMARRLFNERMALKFDLAYGNVRGTSDGVYIPFDPESLTPEGIVPVKVDFSRSVVDLGAQFELNLFGFGMGQSYKGTKRITPYFLAGLGMTLVAGGGVGASAALNIPVGVGVKYKVKPRLNVGAEWTFRFTTTDRLDLSAEHEQLDDPYGINSGFLKSKDTYSFFMLFLTYDLFPKYRKCNN